MMSWNHLMAIFFIGVLGFFIPLLYLFQFLWLEPNKKREALCRQGITGPPASLLYGNIPQMRKIMEQNVTSSGEGLTANYASSLFPYFDVWTKAYGSIQMLYVSQPQLVKEIGLNKSLDLGKPSYLRKEHKAIFGEGITASNGEIWAHQRKIIAPEFFINKVKGMVRPMVDAANILLNSWDRIIAQDGMAEIIIDEYLRTFSADVIAEVCFGSNYSQGKEIFMRLRQLQSELAKPNIFVGIPGMRYFPSKRNREVWRLDREIRSLILKLASERKETPSTSPRKDLLQFMIEGAESSPCKNSDFIVDNCKNIYFAGYETTAASASWCLMLLASHQEWQELARTEVMDVCQGQNPEADMLPKLRVITMVIYESLRLYPPVAFTSREALRDVRLGELHIPKGLTLKVFIPALHRDEALWGVDAGKFNPNRFANGIAGASKFGHAYIPFGIGVRTCAGQNLAMTELKIVLSLLLSKFRFSLSPNYVHSPAFKLTIEPGCGVPLVVSRV